MIVIGIDPGIGGAVAFYETGGGLLEARDMPTTEVKRGKRTTREVDAAALSDILIWVATENGCVIHVVIERQGAMPKQGVASTFSLGNSFGVCRGVAAALWLPVSYVTPREWKKWAGLIGQPKDASRGRASELLPGYAHLWPLKKHHGRADAALIALWGAGTQVGDLDPGTRESVEGNAAAGPAARHARGQVREE